jgi:hypothetical protein
VEAIARTGVHLLHELPGGVVALYQTLAPVGFAVEIRRNLTKNADVYQGNSFHDAYDAFLAATETEIVRQGGTLEVTQ